MAVIQPRELRVLTNRLVAAVDGAIEDYTEDGTPRSEVRLMVVSGWTAGFLSGLAGNPAPGPAVPVKEDDDG